MDKFLANKPLAELLAKPPEPPVAEVVRREPEPELSAFAKLCAAQGESAGSTEVEPGDEIEDESDLEEEDDDEEAIDELEPAPAAPRGLERIPILIDHQLPLEEHVANVEAHLGEFGINPGDYKNAHQLKSAVVEEATKSRNEDLIAYIAEVLDLAYKIDWGRTHEIDCPWCGSDGALSISFSRTDVYGRCSAGCSARDVASGIQREHRALEDIKREDAAVAARAKGSPDQALAGVGKVGWLIPGFLARNSLTILGGPSGSGKTYKLMYVAICVAGGAPWIGHPVERENVVLVLLEGGREDRRTRLLRLMRGLDPALARMSDELLLASMRGRVYLYPDDLKSDDPASVASLEAYAKAVDARLIGIDNLSEIRSNLTQGSESDTALMGAALTPLVGLARRGRTVLLLHHANARGELRGSTAIRQHADVIYELDREGPERDAVVTMTCTKERYGEIIESIAYRAVDDDSDGVDRRRVRFELAGKSAPNKPAKPTGPGSGSEPGDLTPRRALLVEIVTAAPGLGITNAAKAIIERTNKKPSFRDVSADLKWLKDDGWLRQDDDKKYWPAED